MSKQTPKKVTKPKKNKERHAGGRPPIWTSPEVVAKMIDEYFKRESEPTMAGLAVALDVSRSTLYNYSTNDEFLDTIKKARERMVELYEQLLLYGNKPTGVIFALKNTGWADRSVVDHTTKGEPISGFNYQPPVIQNDTNNKTNTKTA